MGTDALLDWLTLYRACNGGSAAAGRMLDAAGGDVTVAVSHVCAQSVAAAAMARARADAKLDQEFVEGEGITLLPITDPSYPPLLKRISGAPLLLFVRGAVEALWAPQLALVGSRNASAGGLATAEDFAATFVARGFTVTSGLAAGIDAAAHRAAIAAGGLTVAVLGTGLDQIYPARHAALAQAVAASGALVSEFAPRTPVRRENFPRRNRIISGLCLGTLVIEASLASGSLITARLAGEQGREVFALPGSIHNPLARGCHQLIREGAKLVETAQEVIDELAQLVQEWRDSLRPLAQAATASGAAPPQPASALVDPDYQQLRQALGFDPVPLDELVRRTGLTIQVLSSMLLRMELEGEVRSNPGGTYSRKAG